MKPIGKVVLGICALLAWLAAVGAVSDTVSVINGLQTVDSTEPLDESDIYRPQPGTLLKTKLCMRCKHLLSAAKMNKKNLKEQSRAMEVSKALGKRAKARSDAHERGRAAAAGALGQPFFGSDPFDPAQVKKDAKLEKCLRLPAIVRPACVAAANGAMMSIPDPSWVKGLDPKVPTAPMMPPMSVPTLETDPHRVTGDPSRPFTPYNPSDSLNTQGGQSPFTGAGLLQLDEGLGGIGSSSASLRSAQAGRVSLLQLADSAQPVAVKGAGAAAAAAPERALPLATAAGAAAAGAGALSTSSAHRFSAGAAAAKAHAHVIADVDADADADAEAEGEEAVAADLGLGSGFGEAVDLEAADGAYAGSVESGGDADAPLPASASPPAGDAAGGDGLDIAADLAAGAPPPPSEPKDPNADSIPGPQPGSDDGVMVMADMPVCINEGSRKFIYSLFRGLVGPDGEVHCSDIK